MGVWKLVIEICLPIPLTLIIALLCPAPRNFRKGLLKVVDLTLGVRFVGFLSLLHFMLLVTGAAFANSLQDSFRVSQNQKLHKGEEQSPNVAFGNLGRKWRAERNFWISFICFFLWCLLARLYTVLKAHARVEEELARKLGHAPADVGVAAPTRPAELKKRT